MAKSGFAQIAAQPDIPGAAAYLERARQRCLPDLPGGADHIGKVAVIGAGTMGRDIALALLLSGRQVILSDPSPSVLDQAQARIANAVVKKVDDPDAMLDQLSLVPDLDLPPDLDMVIEAVPERLDLKIAVLSELSGKLGPQAILATNTSTLDLDAIAAGVPGSDRVIGTHFFMPAHVTRLLELVGAKTTRADVIQTAKALAADLGKIPVLAGNCDGFIGNRLFDRLHQEAMYMLEEGAEPAQIDDALEGWGFMLGPLRVLDMIGNDIPWGVRKQRAARDPSLEQPLVGDRLCEAGWMGQKSGQGWYVYPDGARRGVPSQVSQSIAQQAAADLGAAPQSFAPEQIIERCLMVLILEAARIRAEAMAETAADIDLVYVTGYGFPAKMAGPLRLGSEIGAAAIRAFAASMHQNCRHGARWQVPAELEAILDQVRETENAV
ncbi:MAG: 3-hydroxyacyl-CoA dehydrogenase family protein [Mangrovicoccus sp.]